jgi:hypothetical protein
MELRGTPLIDQYIVLIDIYFEHSKIYPQIYPSFYKVSLKTETINTRTRAGIVIAKSPDLAISYNAFDKI